MAQQQLDILKKGNNLYYTDTDSIITDKPIEETLVHNKALGKFKLEYGGMIPEGYFLANKFYCLVTDTGILIKKTKGIDSTKVTLEDYNNMYINKTPIIGSRTEAYKNYLKGYVKIYDKNLEISPFSYKKREKSYNFSGLWCDTKPLVVAWENNKLVIKSTLYLSTIVRTIKLAFLSKRITRYICNPELFTNTYNIVKSILYIYNSVLLDYIDFKSKITAGLTVSKLFINRLGEILTYQEFYHPKYLVQYIFYITPTGLCLNSFQYNSKLYLGVIKAIIYITSNGLCLTYFQHSSKLYKGIIWLVEFTVGYCSKVFTPKCSFLIFTGVF